METKQSKYLTREQIEEESLARQLVDKMKLIGEDKSGLYFFDRDLESIAAAGAGGNEGGNKAK